MLDSNAGIYNYVTNMASSLFPLSDECHEETAIMPSRSHQSVVIAKLKALQLILAHSSDFSLEDSLVIIGVHKKID